MNSRFLLYSFVFLSGFIFSNVQFSQKNILNADEAFVLSSLILENKIFVSWNIQPGYYLYKKSIELRLVMKFLNTITLSRMNLKFLMNFLEIQLFLRMF